MTCPAFVQPLVSTMQRDAAAWRMAGRAVAIVTTPIQPVGAAFGFGFEAMVNTLLGGCTVAGTLASLARAQVQHVDVYIEADRMLGGDVLPFVGLAKKWRVIMDKMSRSITPTSSDIQQMTDEIGIAVDIPDMPTRSAPVTLTIRRGSITASADGARSMLTVPTRDIVAGGTSGNVTAGPVLPTPEEIATLYFNAATTLASTRPGEDMLRPMRAQIAADMAAADALDARLRTTVQGIVATKAINAGGGRDYLRSLARANMASPLTLDDVTGYLNDPSGYKQPPPEARTPDDIDDGERSPAAGGSTTPALIGAAVGFAVGGPVGAAVGAAAGFLAGR